MPTDALPTHLSRRQRDDVWENFDPITPILDILGGIPEWLLGDGAVGTAGAAGASQLLDSNSPMTISPQKPPLPGQVTTGPTIVPATQPPEDKSFYGVPKPPVGDPVSELDVPAEQPDLGLFGYR